MGAQEGRRKKQRMGTDHDVDLAVAAGKFTCTVLVHWIVFLIVSIGLNVNMSFVGAKKTGGAAALMTSRYFSLERLISIYAQVLLFVLFCVCCCLGSQLMVAGSILRGHQFF